MRSDARFSFLSQTNVDGGPDAALLPNLTQRAEIETARSNRREAQIIRRVAFWYAIPTRRRQENRKNAENFKKKERRAFLFKTRRQSKRRLIVLKIQKH